MPLKPSFAIIGCGRLGRALARYLPRAGYPAAGFASRSPASARKAASLAGVEVFSDIPEEVSRKADLVFITTPDGLIETVCRQLADHQGFKPGAVVLHCSGAHPSTILASARKGDARIGSLHPLQSFAGDVHPENPFEGIIFSVEGDTPAVEAAQRVASDLAAARCLTIDTGAKTLYHASAVVASNYLVTLLHLAFRLAVAAGIAETDAPAMLYPLIEGTLKNIETKGIRPSLTGPIARGDDETIARHLTAIADALPDSLELYKTLGRYTLDIADIPDDRLTALRKLLASG
jgi:predicted short-subunit dehydrogenase-like oxidoreductase (DUF2520 family)